MSDTEQTYTYRNGEKILLEKHPEQFVVRALPEDLELLGLPDVEQVSSHSTRVTADADDVEPLMELSRDMAPTHHAYYVAENHEEFLITDRIFVTFRDELAPEQVDDFAGKYSLIGLERYTDRDYLFQLTDHTGMNPVKLVVKLTEEEPLVAAAEHDLNQRMSTYQLFNLPTDPIYERQWHLHNRFVHPAFDPRASSRCEEAWQLLHHYGRADVVVAVTDDGCKLDHPDFNTTGKFAAWGYFRGTRLVTNADIDANPAEMYKFGANHGTSCAGVIAGTVNALLTVGAAPACSLLPIQWESSGPSLFISDSKMMTVLNFIADKADVMSNSWGGVPINMWAPQVINRIRQLAESGGRRGQGILFLWAAGNENCPIQHDAAMNVPYTHGWEIRPDGSAVWIGVRTARSFRNNMVGIPGLMHVAALASNAQRSHYSNYGTGILICAPTSNVHEYRRLTVTGLGVVTTTGAVGGVTERFGGTSSATPLVAGIAALVISANPDLTAQQVASILKRTASKELSADVYPRTPAAGFDPNPVWDISPIAPFDHGTFHDTGDADGTWSPWFGHGRVDAAKAVAEALSLNAPPPAEIFQQASTPAVDIPDNNPAGVADAILCDSTLDISIVQVSVDISHTYIGDLVLTLVAPSGTAVLLHNRNGGSSNNIQRTYTMADTSGLSAFIGQPGQGVWTLSVQDLARRDAGRLNRWELRLEGRTGAIVELEEAPGTSIPDNKPEGIERRLTFSGNGRVKDVEVAVDITHTYIGDLVVALSSPAGSRVTLHDRAGGNADNLIHTYGIATTTALGALRGQEVAGTWRLNVADLESADVGKLNRWALRIIKEA